ncbi:related to allantoate permease [Cephalotrichum gorgonifer]|uniref:Related to allantoate permease n=1 Tax=Cephalotrichum gorgonifer TaxID=2041049 RepID=A0AAE8MTN9_9PEZI|nr:related to allantoate permease [Cephalotrichum gorgonifer]
MAADPEKGVSVERAEDARRHSADEPPVKAVAVDLEHQDEAMRVLATYQGDLEWTEEEEKAIRRRLDWKLMPVLCLTYGLQHYDKTMLSQAAIFGLQTDLDLLVGARYSWSASIFYLGFIVGAYPLVALAQRFPIERVASLIVFLWGTCLLLTTVCKNYQSLYAQRFFLGFLESGVSPMFMVIVGGFYKKDEQAVRMGVWYSATGLAAMLSPLCNYGLGQINGGVSSWRYMYYFAGAITVAWGVALWWVLPPDPVRAKGYTERERYILVARLRSNNAGVRNTHFKPAQIKELLLDLKFWTVFAIAFLSQIPNGPMSSFIPLIIRGLGFNELNSLLLKMPSGACGCIMLLTLPWLAYKYENVRTYVFAFTMIITVMSSLLLWLLPVSRTGALLFAIYVLPSFSAGYAILMGIQIANTAGYTKKTVSSAGMYIGYCLGNFVGPMLFTKEDAPRYTPGFTVLVATTVAALALSMFYRFLCIYSNKKRDREGHEESFDNAYEDDFTDRTNRHFRYIY